jgi:carbon-monoxide dehydrogenase large subunit
MLPDLDTYVWNLLDVITFPNGCHIAEVEIDPETGAVTLERYTAVDDFGTLINPMLTIGQVQGGVAQGIGQAMLEHTVYDPQSGQMLTGSFMDYALPRASDLPPLDITLSGVPTNANPLGVKGSGQAGAIAAPQAVIAAVLDALAPLGVTHIDMPATPERIWRAIHEAPRATASLLEYREDMRRRHG